LRLPETLSTKPKVVNQTLLEHVEGSRLTDEWYRVFGGERGEGAIIVSQIDEPVYYSTMLSGRVANIVPVDSIDKVSEAVNAYTQTIGIYPESLKEQLRERLALFGAQRLTSLGYAASVNFAIPQDAMEPVRRMCKWIVDERCEPERVLPLWTIPV
jgi:Acyl-CoA reductase (LuxC)